MLNRLNPILGTTVELQGDPRISAWVTPCDGLWPSSSAELRLEPLNLRVGQGSAIREGLEVLRLASPRIADAAKAATLQLETSPLRAEIAANGDITAKRVDFSIGKSRLLLFSLFTLFFLKVFFLSYKLLTLLEFETNFHVYAHLLLILMYFMMVCRHSWLRQASSVSFLGSCQCITKWRH